MMFLEKQKKQKSQAEITMYFHKVIPSVSASSASSSTSPTSSASATQDSKTTPPLPPPQPTQHEDNEDEDLYDNPLPLNEQYIIFMPYS